MCIYCETKKESINLLIEIIEKQQNLINRMNKEVDNALTETDRGIQFNDKPKEVNKITKEQIPY